MCFPSLHCSDSRLLCRALSDAGSGLHALPRSKPLRFRFSGTPQRRRLGWACILHPSQVRATQVTRCLVRIFTPSWRLRLTPSPVPAARFSGCAKSVPSYMCCVCLFWVAGLWLRPSQQISIIQSPKKSWLTEKSACILAKGASLGWNVPFRLWLPSPACLRRGMGRSEAY